MIRRIKILLFIIGLLLIVLSSALLISTTCEIDELNNIVPKNIIGYQSDFFYLTLIIYLFFVFVKKNLSSIIITFFGGFMLLYFYIEISHAGWGEPCGHSINNNFYYLLSGLISQALAKLVSYFEDLKFKENEPKYKNKINQNIINREFRLSTNNRIMNSIISLPLISTFIFLALFVTFGMIGKILLVASIGYFIYRHITRTVVRVYFDLEEVRIKMISGSWFKLTYNQFKHYYPVRMRQGFTQDLMFTFFLTSKKITKSFSVICPDDLEEELGAFLEGKVKKIIN